MTAFPLKPPIDWFNQPEPDGPEPLTVEDDGRVHGHLALWNACHTGLVNGSGTECVRPQPSKTGYGGFHLGQLVTEDGSTVAVGKIVSGSHASLSDSLAAATQHYDKTGSVAAFVRARDGKHGIYLSGVARSDLPPEALRDLRANPPSGDWRRLNGHLEMIAALAVPVPGFQTPVLAMTASGAVEALILPGYCDCQNTEEEPMAIEERPRSYIRKRNVLLSSLLVDEEALTNELVMTADEMESLTAAAGFDAASRRRMAKSGVAMPDGSFPIPNCDYYMRARRAIGRAPAGKRARVMAHINRRGEALGCKAPD